jgi:PAS domain S-box-containing protein
VVATDIADRVTIFNRAAEKLFGRAAMDVIGKMTGESLLPYEYSNLLRGLEDTMETPETSITASSGEEIPVRFCGTVLREGSEVFGSAVFLEDQRERKRIERERLDNERLAAVGQTVAQLAHGIKNILTGIQGGMYALKTGLQKGSTERIDKGWVRLERNVNRITELVKGFLTFSKGHVPSVAPTDAAALMHNVFTLFEDGAKKNNVKLLLDAAVGLKPVNLDAEDMQSCLENLVANALDACLVSDSIDKRIVLRLFEHDDTLLFEVTDNGCGMDYEIKKKVFTTFFTTKGLGGTGLGLLVTRKIVQGHGGTITVTSEPGKGSTFGIELPRSRLPKPTIPTSHQLVS